MIITITGKNQLLASRKLQELTGAYTQRYGDTNLRDFSLAEDEVEHIGGAVNTQPFLAEQSLTVIKDIAAAKSQHEALQKILEEHQDHAVIVLYDPQLDKRTGFFKYLKANSQLHDFSEMNEDQLAGWLMKEAQEKEIQLDRAAAVKLVEHVGANMLLLSSELNKLALFDRPITVELIERTVPAEPRENIFNMLDAAFAGRTATAMKIYGELMANRVEPMYVLSMLIWQLHNVLLVKYAGDMPLDAVAKKSGVSPFVLKKSASIARRRSASQLRGMMRELAEADMQLKSSAVNAELLVETILRRFATS